MLFVVAVAVCLLLSVVAGTVAVIVALSCLLFLVVSNIHSHEVYLSLNKCFIHEVVVVVVVVAVAAVVAVVVVVVVVVVVDVKCSLLFLSSTPCVACSMLFA